MRKPPLIRTKRQRIARWLDIAAWSLFGASVLSLVLSIVPTSNFTAIIAGHVLLYLSFAIYLAAMWAAQRSLSPAGFVAYLAIWMLLIGTGPIVASAIAAANRR